VPDPVRTDVLVYGAGAIGQYLGARLAAAGQQVTLIARPRVVDAVRAQGMRITELDGSRSTLEAGAVHADTGLAGGIEPRLVLLTVKSTGTREAALDLGRWLPARTPVISFQNGVDNAQAITEAAPALEVIAGMVPYNVVQESPGVVHRTTSGELAAARCATTSAWLDAFHRARLPLVLSDDIRAVQWGKLLLNLNNPINALAGVPLREELLDRGFRRALAALQDETLRVLAVAGIAPAQVTPVKPAWIPHLLRLPTPIFRVLAKRMVAIDPAARSSMYDDRVAGRTTEIDALCGAVVRLATAHGVAAPLNRAMKAEIEGIAAGQFRTSAQLLAALGL